MNWTWSPHSVLFPRSATPNLSASRIQKTRYVFGSIRKILPTNFAEATRGKTMLFLAKAALGMAVALALSAAYVFHEGVIKVDVDEFRGDGSHIHFWVPATAVNLGLEVVPHRNLERAARQVQPFLPALRELAKELKKYPNAQLVDVRGDNEHVRISVRDGKLCIDAVNDTENIHVRVPVETISDVADRLEAAAPS